MPSKQSETTKKANESIDTLRAQVKDTWNSRKYTKSFIAIIDVMGIKEFFKEESEFAKQMKLYKEWDFIIKSSQLDEVKQDLNTKYGDFPLKYTMLSDSIVISIDIETPLAFAKLIMYMRLIINSTYVSFTPPFMTRGAIVIGDIFQEDNIVFGPGLIKAHLLESNHAENFRHIIDKQDYESLRENADEFTQTILTGWFKEEGDYYCYDYLSAYLGYVDNLILKYPNENNDEKGIAVLNKLHHKIEDEIKNNKNNRVAKKYIWMRKYFNETIKSALYQTDTDVHCWLKQAFKKN